MKENSIEEDIKILKELGQKYYKNGEIKIKALSGAKYIWALQNLLSDYKRVLKENEEKNKIKEQKECTFREYGAEEGLWYCSNCYDEWLFYEGTPEENNLKYCPHCGAKVIKYESYIETEIEIANKMVKDYLKESEE